jgi:MFS family permease
MHLDLPPSSPTPPTDTNQGPWYQGLTSYHWLVLTVASLGWFFDTMDQQLFNLARNPAVKELLHSQGSDPKAVAYYGGVATSIFIIGWAIGGLIFGILGDKLGRVKTMLMTILIYSAFTGLSALSVSVWDFSFYRFLSGLGVGGEFAVGVSLVAEVMPDRARPRALGWLQGLSAIGNMVAALVSIGFGLLEQSGYIKSSWRPTFMVGIAPALLAIVIFRRLKEPEKWVKEVAEAKKFKGEGKHQLGSLAELFGDPRWRRHTLAGMALAFAGVVGLWGIGFFSPELIDTVFRETFRKQGLTEQQIAGKLTIWKGITFLIQNFGAFWGVYAFSRATTYTGRKPAFVAALLLAMTSTACTFWFLNSITDIFWMIPIMGFCQISLFGGYAIYFPELFPTRLRSTGTSFCYNVGRLVAATGPFAQGLLTAFFRDHFAQPIRYAGVAMCSVFLVGLLALPFLPETAGKPLPE